MRTRYALAAALALLAAGPSLAQNEIALDLDMSSLLSPSLSWSTTPAADSCTASGDWTGDKAVTGTEGIPPIRTSSIWALVCDWGGDTQAVITWTRPSENTDGSVYTNPELSRIIYSNQNNLDEFECLDPEASADAVPGLFFEDVPDPEASLTIENLMPATWRFGAFAVNDAGLCSTMSNQAEKQTTSTSQSSAQISVTVPNAPAGGAVD